MSVGSMLICTCFYGLCRIVFRENFNLLRFLIKKPRKHPLHSQAVVPRNFNTVVLCAGYKSGDQLS